MKSCIPRLKPKKIVYRSYKIFSPENFLSDVRNANLKGISDDPNLAYEDLVCKFRKIVDKHAPLRTKTVRGNEAPFMIKHGEKKFITDLICRKNSRKIGPRKMNSISKGREINALPLGRKQSEIISEARLQMG